MRAAAILLLVVCTACTTTKIIEPTVEIEEDTTICDNKATLLNYTSNSNCGFLFQLEDGTKLLPSSMPDVNLPFVDQSTVFIGYKKYDEVLTKTRSQCGIEDLVVEITCIRKYEDPNEVLPKTHEDCESVANVFVNPWMPDVTRKLKPQKIFEYEYKVGFLYLFKVGTVSYLYDCLGNRMCDTSVGQDCSSLIETLEEGKLIQVLKN